MWAGRDIPDTFISTVEEQGKDPGRFVGLFRSRGTGMFGGDGTLQFKG